MSPVERASLGFAAELDDFDPAQWVKPQAAAEAAGFRSREAAPPSLPLRRRRTGRNVQFNLKARAETIRDFCAVADANGWGLGEAFEVATALLAEKHSRS